MTHDTAKRALNNCAPDSAVRKALQYQEGRLFKPLAFTKTFSMMIAAVLAITLDPAIRLLFMRMREFRIRPKWIAWIAIAVMVGKFHNEENHPICLATT